MKYTKEFLISELQRFYDENGRVPTSNDMKVKFGYPSTWSYINCFGTYNNGVEAANLPLNQTHECRTGFETCCECGCYLQKNQNWRTDGLLKGQVMCHSCHQNIRTDYINGKLNKNSTVASGFISQRVVANVLGLELKDDCNCSISFKYPFDLYDENRYNYINVKGSKLHYIVGQNLYWKFSLEQKEIPDTYVMLGFDKNRKNILKVWITDPLDDLTYEKKTLNITNTNEKSLFAQPWEVDPKPYNDMLHKMSEKRKETNGKSCILDNSDLK